MQNANHSSTRILSIDPSTTALGWALSEYDRDSGELLVQYTGIISANKIAKKKRKEEIEEFGPKLITLSILEEEFEKLVLSKQPNYVVAEDTFYNPGMPQAHPALLLCLHVLEQTLKRLFDTNKLNIATSKKLHKFAPKFIKSSLTGKGNASKQQMIESAQTHDKIKYVDGLLDPEKPLEEHIADAVAIGYTFATIAIPELEK